jgi:hypothetical protein
MRIQKLLSGLLACSIVLSALPASAEPAGTALPSAASSSAPSPFRASLDRAATSAALVGETPTSTTPFGPAPRKLKQSSDIAASATGHGGQTAHGGGMGAVSMVLTLVGTAAGIGATVYMMKQMKKAQAGIPTH